LEPATATMRKARPVRFSSHCVWRHYRSRRRHTAPTIGPLVWVPGKRFDCPVNIPERCRPELASFYGDDRHGWGELTGNPALRLVWITDETGTHYLVVSADDPQLTGLPGGDSFMELVELRIEELRYQGDRDDEMFGSGATPFAIVGGLLLLCPETAGATCVVAGITAVGVGLGNIIRNAMLRSSSSDRLDQLEENLRGRFQQIVLTIAAP